MLGGDREAAPGLCRGAHDEAKGEDGNEACTREKRPEPTHGFATASEGQTMGGMHAGLLLVRHQGVDGPSGGVVRTS